MPIVPTHVPPASPAAQPPISVYLLTFNNLRTVEAALRSVAWADEIVVVDSGSTDGTLEIVRRHASRVIEHPWPGFREQYQFAADHCTHDWSLFIDADEIVPPELAAEMRRRLAANLARPPAQRLAGFIARRRTWYLDRWIRHGAWGSDREMRLYDRRRGQWVGGLHAAVQVDGATAIFDHPYLHYTYANVADHLDTINRYTTTAAQEMAAAGRRFSLTRALAGALFRAGRDYLLKAGFLDGLPGLAIAVGNGYYVFLKHLKLRELEIAARQLPPAEKPASPDSPSRPPPSP